MTDLDRILELPVFEPDAHALAEEFTARFRVPRGEWTVHPAQAAALEGMRVAGGGVFPMGVGSGKTLVAHLAPAVLGIDPDRVLVLCPSKTSIEQYALQREIYAEHFDVPYLRVESYAKLSRTAELENLCPGIELLICDEAHALRNTGSGRGKKFMRAMRNRPDDIAVVVMSASMMVRSILDFAHLAKAALGDGSPLPSTYSRLTAWSRILDADGIPLPSDWYQILGLMEDPRFRPDGADDMAAVECARRAFQCRFASTPGVVRTTEASCDQPITWSFWDGPASDEIVATRRRVEASWVLPDGSEIDDPLRAVAKLRQLSQGFWYYWDWPGEPDREWIYARNEYNRCVRRFIQTNRRGYDTAAQVRRGLDDGGGFPAEITSAYIDWLAVEDRDQPPTCVEWFDDSVMRWASDHAFDAFNAGRRVVIWSGHTATLEWFRRRGAFEVGVPGVRPAMDSHPLVLSIASHGTGLDGLQHAGFDYNIVLCPPANGGTWEQMIGRTHRMGQTKPVHVHVFRHTPELRSAWRSAVRDAKCLNQAGGLDQKILSVP